MSDTYYITTPIYYVNSRPHLGHAYTTIVNDGLARFNRLVGRDVYFLTGTDEHGDKIVQAARGADETPREWADRYSEMFRRLWPELNISNNDFIRTTEDRHRRAVQEILQLVYDRGDIYYDKYGGHYCFGCERFLTETEMEDDLCPDHQKPTTFMEEENYFFRMGSYQDWLIGHIKDNPEFIRPERYKNEVLSFLSEPLEDLCISRPKTRLTWGIELPFDDRFVTYVWFDALINYVSALDWPDGDLFRRYWPAARHTIAKDILKPHAIYWPTMLKSAGIEPYQRLNVHGYWKIGESKMSKSVGNVVEALSLKDVYGLDALRYFLFREMVFGLDSNFSEEALVGRINADLANDLGNLTQRSLTMLRKFGNSRIPEAARVRREGGPLREKAREVIENYTREFESLAFHKALMAVWELIGAANKYIDERQPWVLAKSEDQADELAAVLYELLETLAVTAMCLHPVMPETSAEMLGQLGLPGDLLTLDPARLEKSLEPGRALRKGRPLFPRVEIGGESAGGGKSGAGGGEKPAPKKPADKPAAGEGLITFDQFKQMDLRVGLVRAAERVPKSDKLIKLTVDAGEERTVVAGLGKEFSPEDLVGRRVVVVYNLAPAKLMGVESQGMVLAAADKDGLALLTVDREAEPGSRVS